MRTLVILPFGETDGSMLTNKGRQQMCELALRLAPIIASLPCQIYTSLAGWGLASAAELAPRLEVPSDRIRRDMVLGNESGRPMMPDQIFSLVEEVEASCEVLILVLHPKSIGPFLPLFMRRKFRKESPEGQADLGQAILITMESGARELV